jgi:hypothetical protein
LGKKKVGRNTEREEKAKKERPIDKREKQKSARWYSIHVCTLSWLYYSVFKYPICFCTKLYSVLLYRASCARFSELSNEEKRSTSRRNRLEIGCENDGVFFRNYNQSPLSFLST